MIDPQPRSATTRRQIIYLSPDMLAALAQEETPGHPRRSSRSHCRDTRSAAAWRPSTHGFTPISTPLAVDRSRDGARQQVRRGRDMEDR
jgi:hypothetical protein